MNEDKNIELNVDQLGEVAGGRLQNSTEKRALNDFNIRLSRRRSEGTLTDDDYNEAVKILADYANLIRSLSSGSPTYTIDQYLKDKNYTKYL